MQTKTITIAEKIITLLSFINKLQEFFLITSHPSENSSVKGAEQFCIPSSWLIDLAIDIVKVIRSIVEDSGDDEGAFPSRSKLVWFLLIHSEDQISFLEGSTLDIPGVESTQVLLIDGRLNQGHFSLFF